MRANGTSLRFAVSPSILLAPNNLLALLRELRNVASDDKAQELLPASTDAKITTTRLNAQLLPDRGYLKIADRRR
jgi:hypothetical protein